MNRTAFSVRSPVAADAEAVGLIVAACTRELRAIYAPRAQGGAGAGPRPARSRVVAVDGAGRVVGVVEHEDREGALLVSGLAVAPAQRRCGVAATLLAYLAALAADRGLLHLELATIKETGNAEIFARLGFALTEERISERYVGRDGQAVAEVTLRRHAVPGDRSA